MDLLEISNHKLDEIKNDQKSILNEQARAGQARRKAAASSYPGSQSCMRYPRVTKKSLDTKREKALHWLFDGDTEAKHNDIWQGASSTKRKKFIS